MMKLVLLLLLVAIASDFLGKGNTRQDADTINFPLRDFPEKYVAKRVFHERISGPQRKRKRPTNSQEERDSPPRKRMKTSIPEFFDARSVWKDCCSVREIHNQGSCNSCWAVAVTSVMSDRTCIKSHGKDKFSYSARDLAACCSVCGNIKKGAQDLGESFKYWKEVGIVSGDYGNCGCQPYRVENMEECARNGNCLQCEKKCDQYFSGSYIGDLRRAKEVYNVSNDVSAIQREIMKHGPVAAGIFFNKSDLDSCDDVIECNNTNADDGHAVRIIGWGIEGSSFSGKYWLVANSWGRCNKPIMKIKQGSCKIEDHVWAGIP